ncbi:hypothetical protein Taro_051649 [Colocasia esculenta]|uniref:Uncharacterized protein n=1 Tax=Colocasia esculenta TaxID=4460 RepID=A0A843XHN6_COLES|nr:hypothetical protein [Colocasia esculenta]
MKLSSQNNWLSKKRSEGFRRAWSRLAWSKGALLSMVVVKAYVYSDVFVEVSIEVSIVSYSLVLVSMQSQVLAADDMVKKPPSWNKPQCGSADANPARMDMNAQERLVSAMELIR